MQLALSYILKADTFKFSETAIMEVSITVTSTSTGLIDYRYHQIRRGFNVKAMGEFIQANTGA